MPKKHGTVRPAVRPSGSVNRDRFGRFGLFQSLNDVVHFSFFFFFPKRRRSETAPAFFVLSLLYGVVLPSLKVLKPFLISKHNSLVSALSQISETASLISQKSLSNPHSQILSLKSSHFTAPSSPRTSQLPRAVAAQPVSLSQGIFRSSSSVYIYSVYL